MQVELELDENGRIANSPPNMRYDFRVWKKVMQAKELVRTRSSCGQSVGDVLERDCRAVYTGVDTFFLPCRLRPRCTLERLARRIFDLHARPPFDPKTSGAEWWVQVRHAQDKHENIGFHWDKDEDLVDQAGINVHPQVSTVTYLQGEGAPTVILEKRTPTEYGTMGPEIASTAHLSWPQQYKHISFDGRFLHAAPSKLAPLNPSTSSQHYTRVTFLVNIWLQYVPINARVLPHNAISELGLSDVSIPLNFTSELIPPRSIVTTKQHPISHSFPFGSTGSEHMVHLFLPSALPPSSSFTLCFTDSLGGVVTSRVAPPRKKKRERA
jgi:hypothetical protein